MATVQTSVENAQGNASGVPLRLELDHLRDHCHPGPQRPCPALVISQDAHGHVVTALLIAMVAMLFTRGELWTHGRATLAPARLYLRKAENCILPGYSPAGA